MSFSYIDDPAKKYYIVSIVNTTAPSKALTEGGKEIASTTYTITSTGYVNGAHKKVVATVITASAVNNIYAYSAFSNGTLNFNGGQVQISGDLASNSVINLSWTSSNSVSGYAYAPTVTAGNNTVNSTNISQITAGTPKTLSNQGLINIPVLTSLMPSFSMTGINLTTTWTLGQWGGNTYTLTQPNYYYDGDYALNGHSYAIPDGKTVTIYVNGSFNIYSPYTITGGSLIIYATNGIFLRDSALIKAGTNGTIGLYTPGSIELDSNSNINESTVTLLAYNSVTLSGGSTNKTLAGAVTKIYTKDFTLNNSSSTISGNGIGMVMATNNITLSGGTAATTLMIAGNNIDATNFGVTVAGLYSNNTINISGVKIIHSDTLAASLGLSSGSGSGSSSGSDLTINWSNQ